MDIPAKLRHFLKNGKYQHGPKCETVECEECVCGLRWIWEIAYPDKVN